MPPLAGKTNIALKELTTEPFIFREAGSGTRSVVEHFLAENRVAVDVAIELSRNEAIKQAIAGERNFIDIRLSKKSDLTGVNLAGAILLGANLCEVNFTLPYHQGAVTMAKDA